MVDPHASCVLAGRAFTAADLALVRAVAADCAALGLTEIARTVCELLDWRRPTGALNTHECRQVLTRWQAQGLLTLPALRPTGPTGPRHVRWTGASNPQPVLTGPVRALAPLDVRLVTTAEDRTRWTELIDRSHYLRFRVPVGAQLRYLVTGRDDRDTILACLLWTSAAWTMGTRDQWIGWTHATRSTNLRFVVNNARFLILPWVQVPHLASAILARAVRRLPDDWEAAYGTRPLLLETVIDPRRFAGTCYRAANWIAIGQTQGRGRMDRMHARHGAAPKRVFVYPLVPDAQRRLCQPMPPVIRSEGP